MNTRRTTGVDRYRYVLLRFRDAMEKATSHAPDLCVADTDRSVAEETARAERR